jgi:hypothetical protein
MKKLALCLIAFMSLLSGLRAQEIAGDWQAILHNKKDLRLILHIEKPDTGSLKATLFSIDQTTDGMPVTQIELKGSDLTFSLEMFHISYKGTLSSDKNAIAGT